MPNVVGTTLDVAEARLAAQPLTAVAYQPAKALQPIDRVVAQYPRRGRLSSHESVTLVVPKPLNGVVPRSSG